MIFEMYDFPVYIYWQLLYYTVQQILENGCGAIVTLAELYNHKLARLAQVPHRTADREGPKLASANGNNLFGFSIYSVFVFH